MKVKRITSSEVSVARVGAVYYFGCSACLCLLHSLGCGLEWAWMRATRSCIWRQPTAGFSYIAVGLRSGLSVPAWFYQPFLTSLVSHRSRTLASQYVVVGSDTMPALIYLLNAGKQV